MAMLSQSPGLLVPLGPLASMTSRWPPLREAYEGEEKQCLLSADAPGMGTQTSHKQFSCHQQDGSACSYPFTGKEIEAACH